jgi:archaemetzincin
VLPGDELTYDPKCGPRSVRSWRGEKERNRLEDEVGKGGKESRGGSRRTIYVLGPPEVGEGIVGEGWVVGNGLRFGDETDEGNGKGKGKGKGRCKKRVHREQGGAMVPEPAVEDVVEYLAAFYHPLPVKNWPGKLRFVPWDAEGNGLALDLGRGDGTALQVRTRKPSPDGLFEGQLNLDDLLDGLIDMLPEDAYSVVTLTRQDLYESEEDDFCCGRAYGGSRVAVVSMARYRPGMEGEMDDEVHRWPAAHCASFVDRFCEEYGDEEVDDCVGSPEGAATAMRAACDAAASVKQDAAALWLSRVRRTAAHELGHCFGMDHCVFFACIMQGTASLGEDERQPPFLCPVDFSKLCYAMEEAGFVNTKLKQHGAGTNSERLDVAQWHIARYEALKRSVARYKDVDRMSSGFTAWLDWRLNTLRGPGDTKEELDTEHSQLPTRKGRLQPKNIIELSSDSD